MPTLNNPVFRSFLIYSTNISIELWLVSTNDSIMTKSTNLIKLLSLSLSLLAISRRYFLSSFYLLIKFIGFCFTCWPNLNSYSSSKSFWLHFYNTSFWTFLTIVVILFVIMFSNWEAAPLLTCYWSALKSFFSQVLLSVILLDTVLLSCKS